MGEIEVLNNLRASFVGNLDDLILLISMCITEFDTQVFNFWQKGAVFRRFIETQMFDCFDIFQLCIRSVEIGIDQVVSPIKNNNFCFVYIYMYSPIGTIFL